MSYPTVSLPVHVGDDKTITLMKKSKLVEIYYKMICVQINRWEIEQNKDIIKELKEEIFELMDLLENAI